MSFLLQNIIVANPGREEAETTPGYSLIVYSITEALPIPTQPQSVGGNYSPANALKPRILTYINYSSTVSHYIFTSPCFYHSAQNITYNISHNPHFVLILQIRPLSSRAQDRRTLRQLCLPSPGRIVRTGEPISGPDSGVHVQCLTLYLRQTCQTSHRP